MIRLFNSFFRDRSLFVKFLVFSIIPIVIAILFLSFSILNFQKQVRIEREKERTSLLISLTTLTLSNEFVIYNKGLLDNILDDLKNDKSFICAAIVDLTDNRILSHTDHNRDGSVVDGDHLLDDLFEHGNGSEVYAINKEIIISGEKYAGLKTVFSLDEVHQEIIEMKGYFLSIALIAVVLGTLCLFYLAKVITNPIQALVNQTKHIGSGNFDSRVVYESKDIIGQLAREFNKMVVELKHKQQLIIDSEEKYRDLFNNITDFVYMHDLDGRILNINRLAAKSLGYEAKELIGRNIQEFMSNYDKATFIDVFLSPIKRDGYREGILSLLTKEGDKRYIEYKSNLLRQPQDNYYISGSGHDITDRMRAERELKKVEQQLLQTQKLETIGTLAGGIAHDFNNILSSIFGYCELAQATIDNPRKAKRNLEQVLKGAQRAAELVQQILTFSRQTEYQKSPIAIYLEINETLKLIRSSIPSTIKITKKLRSRAMVMADPIKIHQLVMNLCTNAYHAMRKTGGTITVSLEDIEISKSKYMRGGKIHAGKYLKLEIRDTGHGMDEKTIEKVFDPYYTTKTVSHGTGLGLALVEAIVDEHDSFLEIFSKPGQGTIFYIYFPIIKEKGIISTDLKIKNDARLKGNETIMIVDDEKDIRQFLKEFFNSYGYQIYLFENGMNALETFKTDPNQFDIILTDMTMPGLTGDKLAKQVLKIRPETPVILFSGFYETMSETKAAELGIRKYIKKPIENLELIAAVRKILDGEF